MKPAVLPARLRFVATVGGLLLSAALAGCTESGDEDFVTEHGLRMQASAFMNGGPRVVLPDTPDTQECDMIGVGFSIRAGGQGFPENLSSKGVEVQTKGANAAPVVMTMTSSGFVEADITEDNWLPPTVLYAESSPQPLTFKEKILRGHAKVCAAALAGARDHGEELAVRVRLENDGQPGSLHGIAVLSIAY